MQSKYGFLLMDTDEFAHWLSAQQVNRAISIVQQHHTFLPDYTHFTGTNHFERMRAMKTYHMVNNGWSDIAQNFTTFPDGKIGVCRPLNQVPVGIKGANSRGICIEHFGNFDAGRDQMTDAHRNTIVQMTGLLCQKFSLPVDTDHIVYHHWYDLISGIRRDGKGTTKSCPGTAFFGGNKVEDARRVFIPGVKDALLKITQNIPDDLHPAAEVLPDVKETGIISSSNLNVRSGPGSNFPVVSRLGAGAVVLIYETKNGWIRIHTSDQWVSERFVLRARRARTTAATLNIRSGPGAAFGKLGTFPRNTKVFVYDTHLGWSRIDLNEKWVSSGFIVYE